MSAVRGDVRTLTEWEWHGLHRDFNLADGHAHQSLAPAQNTIVQELPDLFRTSETHPQATYEERFATAFFSLAGQASAHKTLPALIHYSSSVATDVVAKCLVDRGSQRVGLLAPTFDNIPLLLRRVGLMLQPCPEAAIWGPGCAEVIADVDALFLVLPNNPTGREPTVGEFQRLVAAAADAGVTIVCDCSFRLFGSLHEWDQYAIMLEHPDLDFVFIEDTGKTWPTTDLKVGFLCASRGLYPTLSEISNEILLNVSPFTLSILERFAMVEKPGDASESTSFLCAATTATNRSYLREVLASSALAIECPSSRISVEWLALLPCWHSVSLAAWLAEKGIAILPGGPFHWDDPRRGSSFIRVALMRDPAYFRRGADALAAAVLDYRPDAHSRKPLDRVS